MNKKTPPITPIRPLTFWHTRRLLRLPQGLAWACLAVGSVPAGNASVPLLPAMVFDNLVFDDLDNATQMPPSPYADLTDELLPAPAIDSDSVSERLNALKLAYQEAEQYQAQQYQSATQTGGANGSQAANNQTDDTPNFVTFSQLDGTVNSTEVARLRATVVPIGLDLVGFVPKNMANDQLQNAQSQSTQSQNAQPQSETPTGMPSSSELASNALKNNGLQNNAQTTTYQPLDPDEYLPAYAPPKEGVPLATLTPENTPIVKKQPSLFKQAYRRLFKDGEGVLSKIATKVYVAIPNEVAQNEVKNLTADETPQDDNAGELTNIFAENWQFENDRLASIDAYNQNVTLQAVDLAVEPYKNIANALANVSEDSIEDFNASVPRLRELVENAGRAVGYYELAFNLRQESDGAVAVVIYDLGKPVTVASQVLDIRGAGANLPSFQEIQKNAKPTVGEVFHHGEYEATKSAINQSGSEQGFFDARWLGNSVDIVLPDNTADIGMVYDTGEQYVFDDVVFFTLDPDTGELTTDPSKLPVNLSLLKKMVHFQPNEPFARSAVTKLSNELLATRYFNASNVEAVMPDPTGAGVVFGQGAGSQNVNHQQATGDDDNANVNANTNNNNNTNTDTNANVDKTNTLPNGLPIISPINAQTLMDALPDKEIGGETTTVTDESGQVLGEISPIDFSPSQAIVEKVALVKAKAERLLNSPDDRVLDESDKKSTSLLGRVSDTIQKVVQAILPDESKDEKPTLADGETPPTLANKKSAGQVYADKKIPLYVFVMADKPKDAQIGIGYGSDTKWRLTTRFENHLMNQKGFQSGVELGLTQKSKSASAYISRPLSHPVNDKATLSTKFAEQDIDQAVSGFDLTTRSVETALTRTRIKENSWHRSYTLRHRLDSLKTTAPQHTWEGLPVQFLASSAHQEALLLGYTMNKSVQDNLTAPTVGHRQSYSLEFASKHLNSDANMAILRAGLGGMVSFGDNQWGKRRANQLIGRADFGYLWTDDFNKVPYRLRFFAGGDQSVRGYASESLSPVNANGYLTGGQALAVASVEYNREIKEGLRGAIFADVGSAYDKDFKNETKIGVGLGARYASPIGTVRLDVATGLEQGKMPIRLHFLIGLPF